MTVIIFSFQKFDCHHEERRRPDKVISVDCRFTSLLITEDIFLDERDFLLEGALLRSMLSAFLIRQTMNSFVTIPARPHNI